MKLNLKYNEWVQLPYTEGTVENINTQALIEVNSVEAANGVVLYPSQRLRFDEQLYARSLWDNDGVIANVVDFAESSGGGGGGGGSSIDLRPAINAVNTTLQEINTNVSVVGGLASETTHERIADALESLDERMDKIGICSIPYGARRNNTAYQVGDIAYSYNLPPYLRLECVKAGTTAATEPDFSQISGGGGV